MDWSDVAAASIRRFLVYLKNEFRTKISTIQVQFVESILDSKFQIRRAVFSLTPLKCKTKEKHKRRKLIVLILDRESQMKVEDGVVKLTLNKFYLDGIRWKLY